MQSFLAKKTYHRGHTLSEYGLIGGGVIILAISPLMGMGNGLNTLLGNLKGDMAGKVLVSQQADSVHQLASQASHATPADQNIPPGSTVCYGSNFCLSGDVIQSQGHVEVSGANGARQYMQEQTDLLAQIAQQAARDPHTDPALLDLLSRLAKAGHTLGNNLETSIHSKSDYGQFYNAYDSFWRSEAPFDDLRNQVFAYLQAHPSALPPQVQTTVHGATKAINTELGFLISNNGPNYQSWDSMINAPADIHYHSNRIHR